MCVIAILEAMRGKLNAQLEYQKLVKELTEELNLYAELDLSKEDLKPKDICNLSKGLKHNKSIVTLNLSENSCGYKDKGIIALADSLKYNLRLTSLDLTMTQIGIKGFIALAKALRFNRVLINLNLSMNCIFTVSSKKNIKKSLASWAKTLRINTALASLNLAVNSLSNLGATRLANALIQNQALTYLDLTWNNICDKGIIALTSAVRFIYDRPISIMVDTNHITPDCMSTLNNVLTLHAAYLENRAQIINFVFEQITFPTGVKNLIWGYVNDHPLQSSSGNAVKTIQAIQPMPKLVTKLGF